MKDKRWLSIGLVLGAAFLAGGLVVLFVPSTTSADGETFIVNTSFDNSDSNIGNCVCDAAGGGCTLRAAIQEANACPGGQTIRFSNPWYISLTTALPIITGNGTVIDGSDRWLSSGGYEYPGVHLDGHSTITTGLMITASNSAVYGIRIEHFAQHGVYLYGGARFIAIGGVGTHQRNVISNNGWNGVRIEGTTTTTNTVTGNYIGANYFGLYGAGNGWHGASVWYGAGNVVFDNLVADNGWSGVTMDAVSSSSIQSNSIGMNANGEPLSNGYFGVHIANGAIATVSFNSIAFNRRGIQVEGGSDPWIYHNTIYSNTASTLTPPWGGGILVAGSGTHGLINYNDILSNTAHFGGGVAVENSASPVIVYNTIQANRAYTTTSASFGGGGIYVSLAGASIEHNRILSNTVEYDVPGTYPGVRGGGIYLNGVSSSTVLDNEIRGNRVRGNNGGGGGIRIADGDNVQILHNTIVSNRAETSSYGGSAIEVDNDPATSKTYIDGNWVANNAGPGGSVGAVYIQYSGHVTLTNNVIVRNIDAGLYVYSSTVDIAAIHNTIALNNGDGVALKDAKLELDNTIVVSNTGYGVHLSGACDIIQSRNNIWGNTDGSSNVGIPFYMQQNPLFFGASTDQYALRPGSPCLDAGNALIILPGSYNGLPRPQGAGPDIGAYEMAPPVYLPVVMRN